MDEKGKKINVNEFEIFFDEKIFFSKTSPSQVRLECIPPFQTFFVFEKSLGNFELEIIEK